jgi:flavin-dependent dehydrogenase
MVTATRRGSIPTETVDVVIVGAGPAGLSTALHLVQRNPAFAERMVVLERASHPREKLCAGGVSGHALAMLQSLNCRPDIPAVNVERAVFRCSDATLTLGGEPAFMVTRRSELDAWLYRCAVDRGIRVEQNRAVESIAIDGDRVHVDTSEARYDCRVLVGADGTTSLTRRCVGLTPRSRTARLLEVRTPEDSRVIEFRDRIATFDFTSLGNGLEGYYWDFPSLVDGEQRMNRGVFESRIARSAVRANLKDVLRDKLAQRERRLDEVQVQGFGVHHFSPANPISRPNVLLVGDAAGADPLLGEGIRCALGYGAVAATAIAAGLGTGDLSFRTYRRRVLSSPTGRMMLARRLLAALLYRGWDPRVMAGLTRWLSRLQRPGPAPRSLRRA